MVELRFASERLRDVCTHPTLMQKRWGAKLAKRLALRLQQLVAMDTTNDLAFLPFDWHSDGDGSFEVAVDGEVVILLEEASDGMGDAVESALLIVGSVRRRKK